MVYMPKAAKSLPVEIGDWRKRSSGREYGWLRDLHTGKEHQYKASHRTVMWLGVKAVRLQASFGRCHR